MSDMRMAARQARMVRRLLNAALFYLGVLLFGFMCLLWSVPAGICHAVLPRRSGAKLGQWGIMAGFRTYLAIMRSVGQFQLDLCALDQLRDAGPLIIAANHPAIIDAVLIVSRLPSVVCIAKASLWDNWFLGGGIRLAGYLRNDSPRELTRRAIAELTDGRQLLIFPEGTRTEPGEGVSAFKGGFVIMARGAGVPIQTVFLEGGSPYLTKGWGLFRRPESPLVFRARLGRRFHVTGTTRGFTEELRRYFCDELGR